MLVLQTMELGMQAWLYAGVVQMHLSCLLVLESHCLQEASSRWTTCSLAIKNTDCQKKTDKTKTAWLHVKLIP